MAISDKLLIWKWIRQLLMINICIAGKLALGILSMIIMLFSLLNRGVHGSVIQIDALVVIKNYLTFIIQLSFMYDILAVDSGRG